MDSHNPWMELRKARIHASRRQSIDCFTSELIFVVLNFVANSECAHMRIRNRMHIRYRGFQEVAASYKTRNGTGKRNETWTGQITLSDHVFHVEDCVCLRIFGRGF